MTFLGHDGAGDWDQEDAYEAQLRKERGEQEVQFDQTPTTIPPKTLRTV